MAVLRSGGFIQAMKMRIRMKPRTGRRKRCVGVDERKI
jgi:hypothetical protein